MATLIKNVMILTMDEQKIIDNGYVLIEDGKINSVGSGCPDTKADEIIDGGGDILMPGLHNIHTHVPMVMMRGYGDGNNLQDWLHKFIFPVEAKWNDRALRIGCALGLAEMISTGTTAITDMYMRIDNIADLCAEVGINANLTNGVTEFGEFDLKKNNGFREIEDALAKWHGYDNGRIQIDAGIHAEYTNTRASCEAMGRFAVDNKLNMHVHVSETEREHTDSLGRHGLTPIEFLNSCGVFEGARTTAAHCVYVTDSDLAVMKEKHVTAAHNPVSNLKLGSGIAPMRRWMDAGINIGIGTDGVSSNNNHDMFEDIKITGMLHKGASRDPMLLSAYETLEMATVNGGIAMGRKSGKIAPDYWADLILLRHNDLNLFPCHDLASNLVFAAHGSNVSMNMVRGRVIYRNGEFLTLDIPALMKQAKEYTLPLLFGQA